MWRFGTVSSRQREGRAADPPTPETEACVRAWSDAPAEENGDGLLARLVRLYAIESGQPQISRIKRQGLVDFYGFTDGPGTAYFRLHERLDTEHAAQARQLIEELGGRGRRG